MLQSATTPAALIAGLALACAACTPDHPDRSREADGDSARADSDSVDGGSGDEAGLAAPMEAPGTSPAPAPSLDLETAYSLVLMPLECIDRPPALASNRSGYLDVVTYTRLPEFEQHRAFYGCRDWHSAVNSTWVMVQVLKVMPELPAAPLLREKLRARITDSALEGELEYLTANPTFERPYGWVWLLLLHAELASWDDPEAADWAGSVEPLADLLGERLAEYLKDLNRPVRSGTHRSTAFALSTGLRAVAMYPRPELERVLRNAAVRFYARDRKCSVDDEPGRSDFLSPCLEEAALMAQVMDPDDYLPWLDALLPHMDSADFAPLRTPPLEDSTASTPAADLAEAFGRLMDVRVSGDSRSNQAIRMLEASGLTVNDTGRTTLVRRSHLNGLAFSRAEAMLRIAATLPATDPRVEGLRALAAEHGRSGFKTMFQAGSTASHWIGAFALKYLIEAERENDP